MAQALARGEPAPKKPRRKNPTDRRNFKPAVPGALVLCPTRELAQQVAGGAIKAPPSAPFSVSFTGFAYGKAASSPRAPRLRHPS